MGRLSFRVYPNREMQCLLMQTARNGARVLQIQNWFQNALSPPDPSQLALSTRATSGYSANAPRPLRNASTKAHFLHLFLPFWDMKMYFKKRHHQSKFCTAAKLDVVRPTRGSSLSGCKRPYG